MKNLPFLLISALLMFTLSGSYAQKKSAPVNIIFDTDIGPDYDDVGAIAMLHALADSGQATILATIASSKYAGVAPVLSVFNTYFGRPDIPIGVPKGNAVTDRDTQGWSDTVIAKYPHKITSNASVPESVEVYRQILAKQPDKSVTIVTVGFITNLANLLESKPDKYSNLTGKELVSKKVNRLVSMAGKFPEGREYNVHRDSTASVNAFANWPTEIIFSGFEIGQKVKTGLPLIQNTSIQNSPVKDVFRISIPKAQEDKDGRMSWDQTAVLVAIKGVEPYYTLKPGRMVTLTSGNNRWDASKKGHFYLVEKMPVAQVTDIINQLMMHQPGKSVRK
ncbi:nucleoside hydrolase [Rhodocytophaga aerolata]|uniref:Nucleoside hydrolase n=1 Tax=Rhodocytophaga aerolata TaxID=455078 RepID=A0ABT8R5F3_9BACT|nr:nucleoside hydrolase [Rhodocytophaga aerolata]MDO1446906.1 nucleoside hydrolase [Rhodocytophaga aerolata]